MDCFDCSDYDCLSICEYEIKIGTIVYLSASTRSQVATAQHGDHGFPNVAFFAQTYVTKDDNPIAVPFHHLKKM